MATAHVTYGGAMGGGAPVHSPIPNASETITSAASNTQGTAAARSGDYATVDAEGGNIYVAFGQNPDATAEPRYRVQAGQVRDFGPMSEGDKVAVADA